MSEELGCVERENGHHTNPSLLELEEGISCAHGRLMYCARGRADTGA